MPKPNTASSTPPFDVEAALKHLGTNLRTARLARNLSIEAAAAKIGVGYRAVATAETGKPGTAIGVYLGLMWAYGLLPQVKPLILSHVLWMFEYNIRSAAIIGYVGAGGIGLLLHTYQEFGHWDRFSTVLIFILALVTVLDFFGEWLRGKILRDD
mgnify:CR=1 FL=1